ncbi:hypothetical protein SDC9_153878 [bioreactor metagenome]|uniref:Uncharacterized protein n=1 Tax=bioreactor metagenome TaxID=1076179 RepID=A0A645EZD9_9ZZZZ
MLDSDSVVLGIIFQPLHRKNDSREIENLLAYFFPALFIGAEHVSFGRSDYLSHLVDEEIDGILVYSRKIFPDSGYKYSRVHGAYPGRKHSQNRTVLHILYLGWLGHVGPDDEAGGAALYDFPRLCLDFRQKLLFRQAFPNVRKGNIYCRRSIGVILVAVKMKIVGLF